MGGATRRRLNEARSDLAASLPVWESHQGQLEEALANSTTRYKPKMLGSDHARKCRPQSEPISSHFQAVAYLKGATIRASPSITLPHQLAASFISDQLCDVAPHFSDLTDRAYEVRSQG